MNIAIVPLISALIIIAKATVFNSSLLESKLRGGRDTELEMIKFLASLRENRKHFCSGSLISPRLVITSAQCIVKIRRKKKLDFDSFTAVIGRNIHPIKRVNYHRCYDRSRTTKTKHYDVGLVLIEQMIMDSEQEEWIEYSREIIPPGLQATLYAFSTQIFIGVTKDVYSTMDVKIVAPKKCRNELRYQYLVEGRQLCGELMGKNPQLLETDSGSPLILEDKLIGIAMFLYRRSQNHSVFIRTNSISEYIDSMRVTMEHDSYTIGTFTMRSAKNQPLRGTKSVASNSSMLESKLSGGIMELSGRIEYLVSLREKNYHFCSGCMISATTILTAAQCIIYIKKRFASNFSPFTAVVARNEYSIRRVNYHDYYAHKTPTRTKHYDIGLILIEQESIRMHKKCWIEYSLDMVESNTKATLYGWRYRTVYGLIRNYYTSFNVTTATPELCRIDLNYENIKPKQQICGKLDAFDPRVVQADNGSPLVMKGKLIGIVTLLSGRTEEDILLFIRISSFDNYIKDTTILMHTDDYTIETFSLANIR